MSNQRAKLYNANRMYPEHEQGITQIWYTHIPAYVCPLCSCLLPSPRTLHSCPHPSSTEVAGIRWSRDRRVMKHFTTVLKEGWFQPKVMEGSRSEQEFPETTFKSMQDYKACYVKMTKRY